MKTVGRADVVDSVARSCDEAQKVMKIKFYEANRYGMLFAWHLDFDPLPRTVNNRTDVTLHKTS